MFKDRVFAAALRRDQDNDEGKGRETIIAYNIAEKEKNFLVKDIIVKEETIELLASQVNSIEMRTKGDGDGKFAEGRAIMLGAANPVLGVFAERLLGKQITQNQERAQFAMEDILFYDGQMLSFLSDYNIYNNAYKIEPYMSKGHIYKALAVNSSKFVFGNNTFFKTSIEYDDKTTGEHFILDVLFRRDEIAYFKRAANFFENYRMVNITPKAFINSVVFSQDIDKLFISLGAEEPQIKNGCVYRLLDTQITGNDLYLLYENADLSARNIFKIACYPDNVEGTNRRRSIGRVAEFFNRHKGDYFASAEDLYDCMLDFMEAPIPDGKEAVIKPFVLSFSNGMHSKGEDIEMLRKYAIENKNKWNKVSHHSFSNTSVDFFPLRVP
ncbi:MAG: hypothetical protein QXW10_01820 [Candidatus Micrarchaeaceae archaeon]